MRIILLIVFLSAAVLPAQQSTKKPAPQAKTQQEYLDYQVAYAINGGNASEKAAEDFSLKYPASELRVYLYSKAMHEFQNEANPSKMLAMGEKVLTLDPDNAIALVLTATVLADELSNSDRDRDQKINEIKKNAKHALETLDVSFQPPPGSSPEKMTAYKNLLRSMAHSALGIMELKTDDNVSAENDLKVANMNFGSSDPYIWYHLALAQDHQRKYADAFVSIEQSLKSSGLNPDLERLAKSERERLAKLLSHTVAPQ